MRTALGLDLNRHVLDCVVCGDGTQWSFTRVGRKPVPLCLVCQCDITAARRQQNHFDEQTQEKS